MSVQESQRGKGDGKPVPFAVGQAVLCTLFDGHIKDMKGQVIGSAINTEGEVAYLVEMIDKPEPGHDYGRQEGTAQIEHNKKWVLSLYAEEMTAT